MKNPTAFWALTGAEAEGGSRQARTLSTAELPPCPTQLPGEGRGPSRCEGEPGAPRPVPAFRRRRSGRRSPATPSPAPGRSPRPLGRLPSAPPAARERCPGRAAAGPERGCPGPQAAKVEGDFPPPAGKGKRRAGTARVAAGGTHLRPRPCPREPGAGAGQPVSNSKDVSGSGSALKYGRSLPRSRPRGSPRPRAAAAHAPAALSGTAGPPMAEAPRPPRP